MHTISWFLMNIRTNYPDIIRIFVFLCFYMVITYIFIGWKYTSYFKVAKIFRPLLVFTHFFIVISNIAAFIVFVRIDRHEPLSTILSWIGLAVAITGTILIIWAILTLKIATFTPPSDGQLITSGPYRATGHPIYLGGAMAAFGLAIWSASMLALVYALIIALMLFIVSRIEEKDLVKEFGDGYLDYKRKTWLGGVISRAIIAR